MERRERRKVDDEQGDRRRRHRCECPRAVPPGTLVASATGLKPAIDLLDMLATPLGVQGHRGGGLGGPGRSLRTAPVQIGPSSWRENHRPESRMREIRLSGSEGGGLGPLGPSYPYDLLHLGLTAKTSVDNSPRPLAGPEGEGYGKKESFRTSGGRVVIFFTASDGYLYSLSFSTAIALEKELRSQLDHPGTLRAQDAAEAR
jgi:hypothetical protein